MQQTNTLENTNKTVYNDSTESESDINGRKQTTETIGQNDQRRAKGIFPTNEGRQGNNREYQANNEKQIKIDSDNFAKQVDAVKNGTFPQKDMLTLGRTPQILKYWITRFTNYNDTKTFGYNYE